MPNEIVLHVDCQCSDSSHHARFLKFKDDPDKTLYLSVCLCRFGFWKRIWTAIKYVFKKENKFGEYAEIMVDKHTQDNLRYFLERY